MQDVKDYEEIQYKMFTHTKSYVKLNTGCDW